MSEKFDGFLILNKTKKSEPIEYQYPFAFSGPHKYLAQIHDEKHLASLSKSKIHNIMKVKYVWENGSRVIV